MILNCNSCQAKKKIVGLGNLMIDCPSCRGLGYIKLPEDELKVTLKEVMDTPKIIKKRGRKKRIEPVLQC